MVFVYSQYIRYFGYRTKEQLGYVVECGPRLTYRVHGFCFCVQSSKYGPVHLLGRVDNFIKDIEGLLVSLQLKRKHRFLLYVFPPRSTKC